MADIKEIKKAEMIEIIDFYYKIEEYGHIFHLDPKLLATVIYYETRIQS